MKIFVDLEPFYYYPSGIAVYTLQLLKAMRRLYPDIEFHSGYATMNAAAFEKINQINAQFNLDIPLSRIKLPGRIAGAVPSLARRMAKPALPKLDIIHAMSYIPPQWLRGYSAPLIITIHDLAFLRHPGKGYVPNSSATDIKLVKLAVAKATAVIANSRFTRNEICELLSVPEGKVTVTPLGTQFEKLSEFSEEETMAVLKKNKLNQQGYFLATSTLSPRKNYETLLKAFEIFAEKNPESRLVIVGGPGWSSEHIIRAINEMNENVIWLREVTTRELQQLYQNAKGFFMVSHYEGFGIPILEAMTCGCPVCYATGSSMDEIAGDCGIKVHPKNLDEIVDAMRELWDNETLRIQLRKAGLRRAGDFTWEKCAEKTLEVYKKCV
jgi:alpha-1,3-rhamnosyl/mannosyltransferase